MSRTLLMIVGSGRRKEISAIGWKQAGDGLVLPCSA
jgi:hypothetical protein